MQKYRLIKKKGGGTFSEVIMAQSIQNSKYVAIKCMKNHFDSLEQVNNLREIQALKKLSPHSHIVKLLEVLYDEPTGRLALVFELMDNDLYDSIKGRRHYLPEQKVKNYMYQLLKSIEHMHRHGIFHRDIKPENVLIVDETVKLADFGSCRGIYSRQPYTEYISTRWYRAPECLLTDGYYNHKMDIWGYGCVFFELLSLFPLFPGENELDQIHKIHNVLGTPPQSLIDKFKKHGTSMDYDFPQKEGTGIAKLIPHVSPECLDLIEKLLAYNPEDRPNAKEAMKHVYFRDLYEKDKAAQHSSIHAGSSYVRGASQMSSDGNSDTQSQGENSNNVSHHSTNPNYNQPGNSNIIRNKKKLRTDKMRLPELGTNIQIHHKNSILNSEESDNESNLPPIARGGDGIMLKPKQQMYSFSKKNVRHMNTQILESLTNINNQHSISKKINEHKKNYVSPYSQKVPPVLKR
jgi:renal tumor antigen